MRPWDISRESVGGIRTVRRELSRVGRARDFRRGCHRMRGDFNPRNHPCSFGQSMLLSLEDEHGEVSANLNWQ